MQPTDEVRNYLIKIHGARLEKYESSGSLLENIILHKSTVRNAVLRNYLDRSNYVEIDLQARKLIDGFSNLFAMELSYSLCEAIAHSNQEISLPEFDRLHRLKIYALDNAKLIFKFLHSAPSLKFLKLEGGEKEFDCAEVDSVPYCVTSLEEVVFSETADKPLVHLAKIFLKNGLKLKKVKIEDYRSLRNTVVNRLKRFTKASVDAEIIPPVPFSYRF